MAGELEADVTQGHDYEAIALDVLKRAVAEALERKRRLGQYAVVWHEGRAVCMGPDAPAAPRSRTPDTVRGRVRRKVRGTPAAESSS